MNFFFNSGPGSWVSLVLFCIVFHLYYFPFPFGNKGRVQKLFVSDSVIAFSSTFQHCHDMGPVVQN